MNIQSILDNLKIMTIISGHQDLTNYAFLLRNNVSLDTYYRIQKNIYDLDTIYGDEYGLCSFNLKKKFVYLLVSIFDFDLQWFSFMDRN